MNKSRLFAAALSGLTILAVSAAAQSTSGSSTTSSSRNGSAASSAATSPSSHTAATNASGTSGSMNASTNSTTNANSSSFGPGASQFKSLDTDGDGRISRAEFTAGGSTALSAETGSSTDTSVTTNADGSTTKPEKKHWWSRKSTDKSSDMDPSQTFDKLDTNHDGFLDQNELAAANAKLKK